MFRFITTDETEVPLLKSPLQLNFGVPLDAQVRVVPDKFMVPFCCQKFVAVRETDVALTVPLFVRLETVPDGSVILPVPFTVMLTLEPVNVPIVRVHPVLSVNVPFRESVTEDTEVALLKLVLHVNA